MTIYTVIETWDEHFNERLRTNAVPWTEAYDSLAGAKEACQQAFVEECCGGGWIEPDEIAALEWDASDDQQLVGTEPGGNAVVRYVVTAVELA